MKEIRCMAMLFYIHYAFSVIAWMDLADCFAMTFSRHLYLKIVAKCALYSVHFQGCISTRPLIILASYIYKCSNLDIPIAAFIYI